MSKNTLKINATLVSDVVTFKEDESVEGVYEVELTCCTEDMSKEKMASIALDIFHSNVCVEMLDDFSFTVTDPEGNVIAEDESHETYSGSKMGFVS